MATITPPKQKSSKVTTIKQPLKPLEQAPTESLKPIQVRVPVELHHELKSYAASRGLSITKLFTEMYSEYREKHG